MAQSASLQMSARAMGMGNASSCLSDAWALNNNIAGLAMTDHLTAGVSYYSVPSFKPFNRLAAAVAAPIKTGAVGLGVFRFGDDLYNEHVVSLGFANRFGLASLGLKASYLQYRADGLESRQALTVSFGGIAQLTPKLLFGAHIHNINQPVINEAEERVPTRLNASIALRPSQKVWVCTEVEKDLLHPATLKSGLEYEAYDKISFRTGFTFRPEAGFFGLGFKTRKANIDYALQFDKHSGASHQATVTYKFSRS